MERDRDFQRTKVYAWEKSRFGEAKNKEDLSLQECKELASQIFQRRVRVKDGRGRRNACAFHDLSTPTIALPKWARNKWVVAHEVSHLLTYKENFGSGHGGRFMGIYTAILAANCGVELQEIRTSANEFGLRLLI